jgi:Double-GTPase 2
MSSLLWAILNSLGFIFGAALTVICIVRCLFVQPDTITPGAYQAERLAARPPGPGQFEPDKGWPLYPVRQARTDLARTGAELLRRYRRLWRWPVDAFFRRRHGSRFLWWLFLPIPLTVLFGLLVAGFAAAGSFALFAAVSAICVAASLIVLGAGVGILRGAERYRRRVMRTDASCPQCYRVTPWPAYQCTGCSVSHHDIRPGRLGLFWRRCECHALLPTMPLRAAWRLKAVCQRCETALPPGSGAVRDIRIPILGDPSAGKTRFLYAALDSLIHTADRADIEFGFPDQRSKDEAELVLTLIRSGQDTAKTSSSLPPPLNIQLGTGRRQTLVHMFDAAGEVLRNPQMHDSLGFLDLGQGLVYVLDPFSVGSVKDRLTGHNAENIRLAEQAAGDPEIAFDETVSRLRDSGVKADRQRLAVVISKIDLLRASDLELPEDSDAIAEWLSQAGVHNLVIGARRDFAEVRYFTVASQATPSGRRSNDPGVPLRWLLRSHGVRLPPEPARIGAGRGPDSPRGPDRHRAEEGTHDEAAEAAS